MTAKTDLEEYLKDGEVIEGIVFGEYGWSSYRQPKDAPVPKEIFGKLLLWDETTFSYMEGWSFYGGWGSPECYAVYVWTDQRVIWVTQYDGSTTLDSAPRNPIDILPGMPGG